MSERYISVNDAFSYHPPSGEGAYGGTLAGSGEPHVATDIPSLITLRVDYATPRARSICSALSSSMRR